MKCRGCGETVDEGNPIHPRQCVNGEMHVSCELKRLNALLEEGLGIQESLATERGYFAGGLRHIIKNLGPDHVASQFAIDLLRENGEAL